MLVKWRPTQSMPSTRSLFNEFFGDSVPDFQTEFYPRVDVLENKNEYEITAELPGLQQKDLNVNVENNILTIKGEKKFEEKQENENYHFSERRFGSFCRSFRLSDEIEKEKISATFKDGVLRLSLPKAEKAKPKEITISAS